MTRFSIRRQVEFNHCDPAGIVFYPRYFEMISALLERFFADGLGHDWPALGRDGLATPMGTIEARFIAPSRVGDWLTLSLSIARLGGSSVTFEILCEGEDGPRFTARATSICADLSAGRASAWPDALRAAFAPYLNTSPQASTQKAISS